MSLYEENKYLVEFFNDGALIMRIQDKKTLELDYSGQMLLRYLITGKSASEITEELVNHHGVDTQVAETDVTNLLNHLDKMGFLSQFNSNRIKCINPTDTIDNALSLAV